MKIDRVNPEYERTKNACSQRLWSWPLVPNAAQSRSAVNPLCGRDIIAVVNRSDVFCHLRPGPNMT